MCDSQPLCLCVCGGGGGEDVDKLIYALVLCVSESVLHSEIYITQILSQILSHCCIRIKMKRNKTKSELKRFSSNKRRKDW